MNRRKFLGVLVGGITALMGGGPSRDFIGTADIGTDGPAFTFPMRIESLRVNGDTLVIGGANRMFEIESDGRVYELI